MRAVRRFFAQDFVEHHPRTGLAKLRNHFFGTRFVREVGRHLCQLGFGIAIVSA